MACFMPIYLLKKSFQISECSLHCDGHAYSLSRRNGNVLARSLSKGLEEEG